MAGNAGYTKKKSTGLSYETIIREVRAGNLKPVYYLMGDEGYYIDHLATFIVDSVLSPEERDFNLLTYFGNDTDIDTILTAAKAYPMGAKHLVIVVKEAQNLKNKERLELYLKNMQPSTILVFCHKNGTLDRRLKVSTMIAKEGTLYESKKLYDSQLPAFVNDYLKRRRVAAGPEVAEIMTEYVGSDLARMASELDKLILSLPKEGGIVTKDMVLQNIGVSKNYNVFELQEALGIKDVVRVNRIVKYFDSNPKENPMQLILPSIFKFFSNIMLSYYAPNKTESGIAQWLGMAEWQVRKNVLPAMRHYSGVKVMQIISEIRRADARSKGVGGPSVSGGELMKELMWFILH